jgi:hypothetical protein
LGQVQLQKEYKARDRPWNLGVRAARTP